MSSVYTPRPTNRVAEAEDDETAASESLIDRHAHFNGLYRTSYDLRVEGSAEGEIECDGTLTIAPDANIDAKVRARNVVIAGAATGEIMCEDRFTLRPSGQMRGQVLAASLVVEEGAFFEGEFQMSTATAPPRRVDAAVDDGAAASAPIAPSYGRESYATPGYGDAVSDRAAPEDTASLWETGATEDDGAIEE